MSLGLCDLWDARRGLFHGHGQGWLGGSGWWCVKRTLPGTRRTAWGAPGRSSGCLLGDMKELTKRALDRVLETERVRLKCFKHLIRSGSFLEGRAEARS
jgi:hypothetical protein